MRLYNSTASSELKNKLEQNITIFMIIIYLSKMVLLSHILVL